MENFDLQPVFCLDGVACSMDGVRRGTHSRSSLTTRFYTYHRRTWGVKMETFSYRSLRVRTVQLPWLVNARRLSDIRSYSVCPTFSGQLRVFHSLSKRVLPFSFFFFLFFFFFYVRRSGRWSTESDYSERSRALYFDVMWRGGQWGHPRMCRYVYCTIVPTATRH